MDQSDSGVAHEISRALSETALARALEENLVPRERSRLAAARGRLANGDFVVAVIGRQGVGKSSLINALIGRRIAPVDETETTNVLCFLKGVDAAGERAEVHRAGGTVERLPLEEGSLRPFTDEQLNPGNIKKVEKVVCYVDAPLLKTGISLVDTPGVQSLTESAGQVTMEFLPRIAVGLFLLGTSPTLLATESTFLRTTWQHSRAFLFVQNAWVGTANEVDESRADNLRKLREISHQENSGEDVSLTLVDVHAALEGARNDRPGQVQASGLLLLQEAIKARVNGGAARALLLGEGSQIEGSLLQAFRAASARLRALENDSGKDDTGFERNQRYAYEQLDKIGHEWREARSTFAREEREASDIFRADLDGSLDQVKRELRALAEKRDLGAEKIEQALQQRLESAVRIPQEMLMKRYKGIVDSILRQAERLEGAANTVAFESAGLGSTPRDLVWTELLEKAGGAAGGLGGLVLGGMGVATAFAIGSALWAGETVLAALAAGAAAVPGVGWIVAAGVLVGGYALKKSMEAKALQQLIAAIDDAVQSTSRSVIDGVQRRLSEHAQHLEKELDDRMRSALAQQRETLSRQGEDRRASKEEQGRRRAALTADIALLEGGLSRLRELLAPTRGEVAS
jgi:dynamin family protein